MTIEIDDLTTIGQAFASAANLFANNIFLVVPVNPSRAYDPEGREISYNEALTEVTRLQALYRAAGYGQGHRIGLLLDNRLEHLLHKLAINSIGACCVPINPDYRTQELVYLIEHSEVDLIIVLESRNDQLQEALFVSQHQSPVLTLEMIDGECWPYPVRHAEPENIHANTAASILYTSGTTGQPKGCILSHGYELAAGKWYADIGGRAAIEVGKDILYNPLPLYHVNASILSFYCMMLTGGAQVQAERFQPSRFWLEVTQTKATIIHYLGVVVPLLLGQKESDLEHLHHVRFGLGAGVEPQLHQVFEKRYGFPLLEIWGMTEMVRTMCDCDEPRQVGTRAFGYAKPGLDVAVFDELGNGLPDDTPGELVIRYSAETPRKHFFSGYLKDQKATEESWRGGWFHTGDIVYRGTNGVFYFMDRRKNIIRRSGENIASAEIEALLMAHPFVHGAAVLAVADALREEEVLACIVLKDDLEGVDSTPTAIARNIFEHCYKNLAYYKAPGWIWFCKEIPITGTQKIQKHRLFANGVDPRTLPDIHDLRSLKKR